MRPGWTDGIGWLVLAGVAGIAYIIFAWITGTWW